jgi:hypothetical protein
VSGLLAFAPLTLAGCSDDADPQNATSAGGTRGVAGAPATSNGGAPNSQAGGPASDPAARYFKADHLVEVTIEIPITDWDQLRKERRSLNDIILGEDCQSEPFASPFTWKHADVTIDGKTLRDVGLRKKGFLGSLDEARPSLKIATDQFVDQDLDGVSDFTFNNVRQDPGIISECLGFGIFSSAGLPAPRCNFAHVQVNGQDLGVFAHVEPLKKPFLRQHFADDSGALYEGTLSDFREGWLGTFDPKTSNADPSKAILQPIVDALAAPSSELVARLRGVMALDQFARFWATEVALAHLDGYSRNTNNFYVYLEPTTGLASLIPWGADLLFGNGESSATVTDAIGKYTMGTIANALYANADGRQLLLQSLSNLLEQHWKEAALIAEAQRMAALVRPRVAADRLAAFDTAQEKIQAFIGARRATLVAAIANPPLQPVPLRAPACLLPIGTVNGTFTTTWGSVDNDDPFTSGSGTLDVTVNGTRWQNLPGYVGAVAGLNPDPDAAQAAQVAMVGVRTNGQVSVMAFGFDLVNAVPGSWTLDLTTLPAILLQMDMKTPDTSSPVGVVLDGTLDFEQIGTTDGSPVKGKFSGILYDTPFLNGF